MEEGLMMDFNRNTHCLSNFSYEGSESGTIHSAHSSVKLEGMQPEYSSGLGWVFFLLCFFPFPVRAARTKRGHHLEYFFKKPIPAVCSDDYRFSCSESTVIEVF